MATPNRVNYYTYKKIPGQKISQSGMDALVRMCNERFEDLSTRLYGNLQYKDLSASTKEEISESATDVTSEDVKINATDGLRIDTVLSSGETTAAVYFSAKGTQIGLYRTSDDKQLWGGKLLADGRVVTVTNVLLDPDGNDNAYFQMNTDDSAVSIDLVHGTHAGTGPESDPLEEPPITAWEKLVSIIADVVPNWVPGEYGDEIFITIRAILKAALAIYGSQIYISALDASTEVSKCGISFDAEGDSRIRTWGHIIPTENDTYVLGSPGLTLRYKRLYCNNAVDVSSDERLKQDVKDLDPALIMKLRPRSFRMRSDSTKLHYGLIAQEVKAALDECGIENADLYGDENPDSLSLRYEQFIAPLIATVQAQDKRIKALEDKLGGTA